MKQDIGLVLSGGGVRGAAHLGVLQAFGEYDIEIHRIAGVSAGAIIGAFHAAGYTPKEILAFLKETPIYRSWSHYTYFKPGVLNTDHFRKYYEPYFPEDSFEALQKHLSIVATDIIKVDCPAFDSGPLIQRVLASSAFPFVFTPVEMDGSLYADGGIMNNFPIEPLCNTCRYIIGIYVNPLRKMGKADFTSSWKVTERAFGISTIKEALRKFEDCHWVIMPTELAEYNIFDKRRIQKVYDIGYDYGLRYADRIAPVLAQGARVQ